MDRSRAKERTTIRLPPMVTILMTAAATLRTTIQTVLRQSYDSRATVVRQSCDSRTTVVQQSYYGPNDRTQTVVPRPRRSCDNRTTAATTQTTSFRQSYHDQEGRATVIPRPKGLHPDGHTTIKTVVPGS